MYLYLLVRTLPSLQNPCVSVCVTLKYTCTLQWHNVLLCDLAYASTGNWTQSLRRVVESVYSFFSYDVNTYIAGNLEVYEGDDEEEGPDREEGMKHEGEEGGGADAGDEGETSEKAGDKLVEVGERSAEEDDEETDDAMSGAGCDTSTEEDAFEDSQGPEGRNEKLDQDPKISPRKTCTDKSTSLQNKQFGSTNHRSHPQSPLGSSQKPGSSSTDSSRTASNGSTNKTISSFTVENILMGNTSRSNSTSSGSPTSAPHASTTSFLPFNPGSTNGSTPASPASANWTSHPPVKYTKFTMVSPTTMKMGGDRRRKCERDKTLITNTADTVDHRKLQSQMLEEAMQRASRCKEEPKSPPSVSVHLPTPCSTSHAPQLTYHHSVIQTAVPSPGVPLSRQSSSQSVSASPHLIPVSPNPFHRVQTQQSPQQQQYVVFFPPNVAFMTAPSGDMQVFGQAANSGAQLYIQGTPNTLQQTPNGTRTHKKGSPHISSSSPSPPPNHSSMSGSTLSSNNLRIFRTSSNPSLGSSHNLSDAHFHSVSRKIGSKSLAPVGEKSATGGKGMPKQKKLRFHMTTVVKKVRRRSSSVSLTAPPPTLCNRTPSDPTHREQQVSQRDSAQNNRTDSTTTPQLATTTVHTSTDRTATHPGVSTTSSTNSTSTDDKTTSRPPHSSQTDMVSTELSQQSDLFRFENTFSSSTSTTEQQPPTNRGRGRGRGKRARGYTRRKRELTFHLYEDPYRAKRTRQQN